MGERARERSRLAEEAVAWWPSLPFMAFGLWQAWSYLAYSGSLWLSDSETDGTYLSQLFIFSTFACALTFLAGAMLARCGRSRIATDDRRVMAGGALTSLGCLGIIAVGPYYLGSLFTTLGTLEHLPFWVCAVATGVGTGLIGLRCGALYGSLPPRRALVYAALSQLVAAFVYLLNFACPNWAPVAHGPSLAGILFFCLLPLATAALACVPPAKAGGGAHTVTRAASCPSCRDGSGTSCAACPNASTHLPPTFWRFAVFSLVMSLLTSMTRSAVVTTHALATTLEGNNLIMVFRALVALVFIVGVLRSRPGHTIGLGKVCTLVATVAAVIMACAAAFGGITNEWSILVYLASSVFDFVMWCLLAFIVVQKRVSAVATFGWGRGLFMLGCGAGWMLGSLGVPLVPDGTPTTVLFVVMAGVMLLLAGVLFSERDYERLFSPVSEDELSLDDLFDLGMREHELVAQGKGERKGRFTSAVEQIAAENALSAREAEVLRYLAMGYGSERIADTMQVKVNTVRTHTHNVYVKLDVHSREDLMRLVDAAVAQG